MAWNDDGMIHVFHNRCFTGMFSKLLIIGGGISGVVIFLALQPPFRESGRSKSTLAVRVSRAGKEHGAAQKSSGRTIAAGVAESDVNRRFKRPIWVKLDSEREEYERNFVRDSNASFGRGVWRNSKQVRFWTDQLVSGEAELAAVAAQIIEGATWENAGILRDLKGSDRNAYTQEEWESHQIFNTMIKARALMSGARNSLPSQEAVDGGDTNDSLVLKDAQSVLIRFVPRLRDSDPSKVAAAKSVINFFTYDIFRDEPPEWWEAVLHDGTVFGIVPGNETK